MTDQGTACKFFFLLVKDENIDEDCINLSVVYCKYESYEKKYVWVVMEWTKASRSTFEY